MRNTVLPITRGFVMLAWAFCVTGGIPVHGQTSATIDIDTSATIPVRPNFGGFNDSAAETIEYWDQNFTALAAKLTPGWDRYPGGGTSDAFNWQTGLEEPSWVTQFSATPTIGPLLVENENWAAGKGGGKFIDAANRAKQLGCNIVVCVNAFTDTAASAGQMAAYAKTNSIPVVAWELANEAYNIPAPVGFAGAADYLTKMKPFYTAIKAADPNANVAIFLDDPGKTTGTNPSWNKNIASYSDKYWDSYTYHHYPAVSTGAFSQWMADENGVLATTTDAYVTGYLEPTFPGKPFLVSEYNPAYGTGGTNQGATTGTLYGALFVAEFAMRMSTVPSMLLVGSHELPNDGGVAATNYYYTTVTAAATAGKPIDTSTLNYGYFISAQGTGPQVLYGVLNHAVKSNKTTVTGGATVAATGPGQVPALYALAYTSSTGSLSLVLTNKSATAHQVTIRVNGNAPTGTFSTQFVTGTDPSTKNTSNTATPVAVQTGTSANPVSVPPYSVMRIDLPSSAPKPASPARRRKRG
jgi:hypothetical protein